MSDSATDTDTAAEIVMPRLSDSMEEGTILRWLIADGERVARGQELVEIETDKASMTYESDRDGVLEILVGEGESVAVGVPIARVGAGARLADSSRVASDSSDATPEPPLAAEPAHANGSVPAALVQSAVAQEQEHRQDGAAVLATPLARRAARVHEIELAAITGSGPRGRVLRADVLSAAGVAAPERKPASAHPQSTMHAAESPAAAHAAAGTAKGDTRRVEPTRAQRLIARRMAEAKATIPEFQVQTEAAMDTAIAFRAELKEILEAEAPSLNDLVVKACALALRGHERANGSYIDGAFELHERVNVGVAVAAEDALVVPVVQDADKKALGQIARETRRLAERVRLGQITPPELSGATFTVSNLGMYGMTADRARDQPAAGRDPRRRCDPRGARPRRRRGCRAADDDAHAELRPPHPLRRRRRAVPRRDKAAAASAAAALAVRR